MQERNQPEGTSGIITAESIAKYLQHEQQRGTSEDALRRYRRYTASLYDWLPEDRQLTKERLSAWRQSLKDQGYSPDTELKYIKGINRYLDFMGYHALRFSKGRPKNLAGVQFGYLTALEPVGTKQRNILWRCRCQCGREVDCTATRLISGNTLSCGCLRQANLSEANQYFGGTSLRRSLEEQVLSDRSASGYTGVAPKGDKWRAYVKYKGQYVSLGTYTNLEDAVKARARGKELVRMEAMGMLDFYEELHKNDPIKPRREQIRQQRIG